MGSNVYRESAAPAGSLDTGLEYKLFVNTATWSEGGLDCIKDRLNALAYEGWHIVAFQSGKSDVIILERKRP